MTNGKRGGETKCGEDKEMAIQMMTTMTAMMATYRTCKPPRYVSSGFLSDLPQPASPEPPPENVPLSRDPLAGSGRGRSREIPLERGQSPGGGERGGDEERGVMIRKNNRG